MCLRAGKISKRLICLNEGDGVFVKIYKEQMYEMYVVFVTSVFYNKSSLQKKAFCKSKI